MKDRRIDLTIVVTTHSEGILAHKTMMSVLEAAEKLKTAGYSYEMIIHIDNGDVETKRYFERYNNMDDLRIFENEFGDLGSSRNFVVQKAKGEMVTFLDGDDLVSPNWYFEAMEMIKKSHDEVVVHPEVVLTFGNGNNVITRQWNSSEEDRLTMVADNCWCSVVMARKTVFLRYPYRKMGNGYGYEDYAFNADTLQDGIEHKIAPETVLFYRRSEYSMLSNGNRDHLVLPYVKYLDFENFSSDDVASKKQTKTSLKSKFYKVYKKIRKNDTINYFITPVAKVARKTLGYEKHGVSSVEIPDFVMAEWKKMNHIDSQLYPTVDALKNISEYSAKNLSDVGACFVKIAETIHGRPDYIFMVPWLVRGGADKVLINYITAFRELHPDWKIMVITTLPTKNTWSDKLPEGVDLVEFGRIADGLVPDMQDMLFSRMITELDSKRLHIINSEYAYEWALRHIELIKRNYELNVSIFAWEYVRGSEMKAVFSYDNPCLFNIYSAVKNIFTDNLAMAEYMVRKNAFDKKKIKVHYQPMAEVSYHEPKSGLVESGKIHLLWAGRVVPEKLPELVAEIGRKVDASKVSIDIYGEIGKNVSSGVFDNIPAIKYRGEFDGFSSLPTGKYDALLYASLNDGMPNVILEAAAAGLPIIASDDGGVGEFVKNNETGILIKDYLDAEKYVEAIKYVFDNFGEMTKYAENAQKLLAEQHGWGKFVNVIKRDIG